MTLENKYRGYSQAKKPGYDQLIVHTDYSTPAGEYLRRYWHPVALSTEVTNTPLKVKILGEDLVIFKTTENKIGLIHKYCTHRRASLVYGKTESRGIRCCYHGWLFSPDGEILEIGCFDANLLIYFCSWLHYGWFKLRYYSSASSYTRYDSYAYASYSMGYIYSYMSCAFCFSCTNCIMHNDDFR